MTDRANADGVRWSTVAVVVAFLIPLLAVAAGWGTLNAKVDGLSESTAKAEARAQRADERAQKSDDAINSLNISVARLSSVIDALTQRITTERRSQP